MINNRDILVSSFDVIEGHSYSAFVKEALLFASF